jgi:glycosyltransferase involved in cell wall biosynthesis
MRILQVVHGFPPSQWAGAESVTFYLAQALRERGHQVTIFTRTADPEAQEFSVQEDQVEGLSVVRVVNNYTYLSDFHLLYDSPFFDSVFLRLLEQVQPEVLHFQHVQHLSIRLLSLAAALGYRTLLTLHDFFFPCHLVNLINTQGGLCSSPERGEQCVPCLHHDASPEEARRRFLRMEEALRAPDLILTPSTFLARKIADFFPALQNKLRVAPLGVKVVPRVAKTRASGAPLRILYVGVFLPHKGAHVLVEALKRLPVEAFEASLYGVTVPAQQSYMDRIRQEVQGLPVRFFDGYPHDQIGSILAQHDVLVMPSICEETFSLVTREALSAGVPVIVSRRGALSEAVQDEVNGLLFEPENPDDLRHCLARLIAEPEMVKRLGAHETRVKTLDEYADDVEHIYDEMLASPGLVPSQDIPREAWTSTRRLFLELSVEKTALWRERECLSAEKALIEQERDRLRQERDHLQQERDRLRQEQDRLLQDHMLILEDRELVRASAKEFGELLDIREDQLLERNARLEAIYASTTWKLYQAYETLVHSVVRRPGAVVRQWLRK